MELLMAVGVLQIVGLVKSDYQIRCAEGILALCRRNMAFYLKFDWRSSRRWETCFLAQTKSLILLLHLHNLVLSPCWVFFLNALL